MPSKTCLLDPGTWGEREEKSRQSVLAGNFGARPGSLQPVTPSANEGSSGYVILLYKSRYGPLPQHWPDNFVFVVSLPSGYDMPLGFYLCCQGGAGRPGEQGSAFH